MQKAMSLAKYQQIAYTDKMSIYRTQKVNKPNGAVNNEVPDIETGNPIYSDINCRLSFKSIDAAQGGQVVEPIKMQGKVFCAVDTDIQAGDMLKIDRYDGVENIGQYIGIAGQPARYGSHCEVFVDQDDFA